MFETRRGLISRSVIISSDRSCAVSGICVHFRQVLFSAFLSGTPSYLTFQYFTIL
jgi:hypothetical protein